MTCYKKEGRLFFPLFDFLSCYCYNIKKDKEDDFYSLKNNMKNILSKYKILLYIIVISLIVANVVSIAVRKNLEEKNITPIFVIYSATENPELKTLFFEMQEIETTKTASYMYVDPKSEKFTTYKNAFNLKDYNNAFIVLDSNQIPQGIKAPCPKIDFIKEILEKYNY